VIPLELKTRAQVLLEERGGYNKGFTRRVFTKETGGNGSGAYPVQGWVYGTGANMSFRKSALVSIGGFDERLRSAEDLDVFFRLIARGFELIYEPVATVSHKHPESYSGLRKRLFGWGWGYATYLLKISRNEPSYRTMALRELNSWLLRYHVGERLLKKICFRDLPGFPLELIIVEIAGGVKAVLEAVLSGRAAPGGKK
jgi:cellulose synthase/poly-beta-1,6-N-acetylglucosamine synthase-like glycosyltransferase